MFDSIRHIPVDRKNSLPVSDLRKRYQATGIPVVFGDLTKNWPAVRNWNLDYVQERAGELSAGYFDGSEPASAIVKPTAVMRLKDAVERLSAAPRARVAQVAVGERSVIAADFTYPRLGFRFLTRLTSLYVGGEHAVEPMQQASSVMHTVRCHFGARAHILLIPPKQTPLMYRVGKSQHTIRDINFLAPQFDQYPALKFVSGYVAELDHGDAVYIPAGYWYCVAYEGIGIQLSLHALSGSLWQYISAVWKRWLTRVTGLRLQGAAAGRRLSRRERRVQTKTNRRIEEFVAKRNSK
ncbi:hypothetical protein GCM10008090_00470 [Arenicella chitinivorans]|uniref:Cupin-like domain-containing protein n=1 Tax=Arenicella chitinivorans TaxID=1329800 RepID=A0A918VGL6_9GAMM|nr:cupin-like domain-containing protein [Arenicella chitinivorans]GGZ96175.1 hypothetical protein GCM10008090_00470 [Arenicella chitinivorans]